MSYDVGTGNASRVVGPLASGILLAQFGVGGAFWLGSILLLAGLIVTIRLRARREPQHEPLAPFLSSMLEGFAWVRRDVRLIGVLMMTTIFNVFGWSMTTMIPVIGTDYLHLGPRGVGLLASCEGVGGLIGAVLIGVLGRPQWYGRIYVCAVGSYLLLVIAFALAPTPGIAAVLLTLAGMSTVAFAVMQATLVYRDSPPNMRSRLLGVLSVCIGLGPFGFAYLGFLADAATPRIALIAMALQGLLVMALTSRFWIRLVRSETTAAR